MNINNQIEKEGIQVISVKKDKPVKAKFVIKLGPEQVELKLTIYQWLITAFIYNDPECPLDMLMNERLLHLIRLEARKTGIVQRLKIKIKNIHLNNIFYVHYMVLTS